MLRAAACLAAHASALAVADTTVSWAAPVSGSWTNSANWSPAIVPINGSPPGASYDVTLGAVGTSTFDVRGPTSVSLDSLTINSPNVRLSGGTFTVGALSVTAGDCSGVSAFKDTHIQAFQGLMPRYLDDVTIDGDIGVAGGRIITNSLINDAGLSAQNSFVELWGQWRNNGSMSLASNSTLFLGDGVGTLGAASFADSTLDVASTLPGAALDTASFASSKVQVDLGGTVMNDGRTITIDPVRAAWTLFGGTIHGGTIAGANGGSLTTSAFANSGTLDSVTLASPMDIGSLNTSVRVAHALHLDGSIIRMFSPNRTSSYRLWTVGDTVIDGHGEIRAENGVAVPEASINVEGSLTIGEGVTLRSGSAGIYLLGFGTNSRVVLRGSMIADYVGWNGNGLDHLTRFENQGTISVLGGAGFGALGTATMLANISNGVLSGGHWLVSGNSTLQFGDAYSVTTTAADIRLDGPGSTWTAINSLADNRGTFTISNGRQFATVGSFSNSGTFVVGAASALKVSGTLANTGTIDLSGAMIVDYTPGTQSPRDGIAAQISNARHGGSWDQPGITSTAARNAIPIATTLGVLEGSEYQNVNEGTTTFAGISIDDSVVLVKYTYYGDTDFNGRVNFDDYIRTDNGFNNHLSGWLNGDFDLNGAVNFDDYVLIDLAFNAQSGTLARALSFLDGTDASNRAMNGSALRKVEQHFAEFGQAYAAGFLAAVPEPVSAAALCATAIVTTLRRCRRRRI